VVLYRLAAQNERAGTTAPPKIGAVGSATGRK
jgi:hypothetical protein